MRKLITTMILLILMTTNIYANSKTDTIITYDDYYILAHVINGEAGSLKCSDTLRRYVGSVVLNRVDDPDFPNTIREVVFQKGQYQCTWNGLYNLEPSEDSWKAAYELLESGSLLPTYVIWQAEFPQGNGWYCKEQNMYFSTKKGTQ